MSTDERAAVEAALPGYEVGEVLGRGGWGVVLAGRHRELGRDVAIKQLPPSLGRDPALQERFRNEARLIAGLDHPHIVPVYDFVEHDGLCLLVMERMTGGTLWDRFRDEGLRIDQSCALMLAALVALQHAHDRGILHRDVKPENLMFAASGTLKLADFGIAKVLGATGADLTVAGQIIGTPAYMAPEQAAGEPVGPFTDVYGVGAMLYELMSGDLPFPSTTEPLGQLTQRLLREPTALVAVRPDLPPGLADTVMGALRREPDDRFGSARAFAAALAQATTAAYGAGWLRRTGVEVAGATELVALTEQAPATPVRPAPERTVQPTTGHVSLSEILSGPSAASPPPVAPPTAAVPGATPPPAPPPAGAPPSVPPAPPAPAAPAAPPPAGAPSSSPPAPSPAGAPSPTPAPAATPPPVAAPPVPAPAPAGTAGPPDPVVAVGPPAGAVAHPTVDAPPTPPPMAAAAAGPEGTSAVDPRDGGRGGRGGGRVLVAVLGVVALVLVVVAGVLAIGRSRDSGSGGTAGPGGPTGSTAAPTISSVDVDAAGDTARITWSDTAPPGTRHVVYAWAAGAKREVAATSSPASVAIAAGRPTCFQIVAVDDAGFTRSAPRCINGGDPSDLVGGPASPPGTA